jgi:hypothetical protein
MRAKTLLFRIIIICYGLTPVNTCYIIGCEIVDKTNIWVSRLYVCVHCCYIYPVMNE